MQRSIKMPKQSQGSEEFIKTEQALAQAIGARIKQRRKALGLLQEEVRARMEALGVHTSKSQYSRIEKGRSQPNAGEVLALSYILNTTCDWVLGFNPNRDDDTGII